MYHANKLFVYGTLMDPESSDEARLLFQKARIVGQGYFHGRLLHTGEYPAAVTSTDARERVYGFIVELPPSETSSILQLLDEYEECGPTFPEPTLYRRKLLTVYSDNQQQKAWVYLYNRPTTNLKRLRGDFYIKNLQKLQAKFAS